MRYLITETETIKTYYYVESISDQSALTDWMESPRDTDKINTFTSYEVKAEPRPDYEASEMKKQEEESNE